MGNPQLQKPGEMCPGRQIGVPGKFWNFIRGRMRNEEETLSLNVPRAGFMLCTSGLETVLPVKQWSSRRWVWMDSTAQNPVMMTKHFS